MNVRNLISELKSMDQNSIVVIASDAEGNNFNPLYAIDEMQYVAESPTSGRIYEIEEIEEEGIEEDYENAVVLWP